MEEYLSTCARAQDFVSVLVKMNRCQYAQLVQPAFEAPKAYPMPPGDAPDYRPATLGMRLTCAFQMMYDGRARFDGEPRAPALMDTAGPSPAEISARAYASLVHIGCGVSSLQTPTCHETSLCAPPKHRDST